MNENRENICYLLVNFGGPREITEIKPFLTELLTDQDVVRTGLPSFIHRFIFSRVAAKRSKKVAKEYESMGGKSPIYGDTEELAQILRQRVPHKIYTFHRYIPNTHQAFINTIKQTKVEEIRVFPLFPQFTYATTGSIARWLQENLPYSIVNKMRWIKSYASHPAFIQAHCNNIQEFLEENNLKHEETILLFSAHGIPKNFVTTGDIYAYECNHSFQAIKKAFPSILCKLSYQSKFGPGEWLKPYTIDTCKEVLSWSEGRKSVVFIPISFTSDHIETLCEIENDYMTEIREAGLQSYRVPALTIRSDWVDAICKIIQSEELCNNQMLVRSTLH